MNKKNNNKLMILKKEIKRSSVIVLEVTDKSQKSIQDSMKPFRIRKVKFSSPKMRKDFSGNNRIRISLQWIFLKDITTN